MTPRLRIATHGGRNLECSWRVRALASAARRQGIASGCLSLLIENNSLFGPKISLFSITGNSGLHVRNHSGFRANRAPRQAESVEIPCTFPVEHGIGRGDQFAGDCLHRHLVRGGRDLSRVFANERGRSRDSAGFRRPALAEAKLRRSVSRPLAAIVHDSQVLAAGHRRDEGSRRTLDETLDRSGGGGESSSELFCRQSAGRQRDHANAVGARGFSFHDAVSDPQVSCDRDPAAATDLGQPFLVRTVWSEMVVVKHDPETRVDQWAWEGMLAEASVDEKDQGIRRLRRAARTGALPRSRHAFVRSPLRARRSIRPH